MKKSGLFRTAILSIAIGALLIVGCGEKEVEDEEFRFVKLVESTGDVSLERNKKDIDVTSGMMLQPKDVITTGDDSEVIFLVDSDKHISENANTSLSITANGNERKGSVKINLLYGDASFVIDNKLNENSSFEVVTPNATLSVRGTTFQVAYDKESNATFVEVEEGVVYADYEGDAEDEEIPAGEIRVITEEETYNYIDESIWNYEMDIYETEDVAKNTGSLDNSNEGGTYVPGEGGAIAQYNAVIQNVESFVAINDIDDSSSTESKYENFDYLYYDYDYDGEKEVILYLRYDDENGETRLDLFYLDYTPDKGVYLFCRDMNNVDFACFVAEYKGKLVKVMWTMNPETTYIYEAYVEGNTLRYVDFETLDYVIVDLEGMGMKPLPVYGSWELILE